jgi:hypothetical protein
MLPMSSKGDGNQQGTYVLQTIRVGPLLSGEHHCLLESIHKQMHACPWICAPTLEQNIKL